MSNQLWPGEFGLGHIAEWVLSEKPPTPDTCPEATHSHTMLVPLALDLGDGQPTIWHRWEGRTPWDKPWYVDAMWKASSSGADPDEA